MALLDLLGVSKNYETKVILNEVNFHIEEYERIAIIGKNGGGKSTLMKIVNGILEVDAGERIIRSGIKVEMLAQDPSFKEGLRVREAIENELKEIREKKEEYLRISSILSEKFDDKTLVEQHGKLSNFLDHHNAWNIDDKIERVLVEFDLKIYENRVVSSLSGGEQRRVALASLMLKKPDILLLDEPTNHLDVYMVEFIEELLKKERFTVVFISHDRYFIENIATRTVEIEDGKIRSFDGGYENYLRAKELLLHSMEKEHETLLKILKHEEEWLRRGVKARLKRNEGRKGRVLAMREDAKKNPSAIKKIKLELEREKKHFNRDDGINKRKMLFEIEHIYKNLGGKILIEDFSTRILQSDKIAIVGKNGSGKSTLIKILLQEMAVDKGFIQKGEFEIGYFDQQRLMLDDSKNIIETFCPNGGDRIEADGKNMHVYGYLKDFLFPKEHLDKKIGILSGGEKNRVALALLFAKKYDCLILDEPTNDLDLPTINMLEEYLLNYQGAVVFVSHDRYFVDKIAKKLIVFSGNGNVFETHQPYSEYLEIEKELKEIESYMDNDSNGNKDLQNNYNIQKEQEKINLNEKKQTKLSYKEKLEYEQLPKKIEILEEEIAKIKKCLENPDCYQKEGLSSLSKQLQTKEEALEIAVERFLEIEEKIEGFLG